MTMGKITLDKDSKKSAEDAKAAINDAAQENKTNTKTAVEPKVTITVEDAPLKKKDEKNEKDSPCCLLIGTILILIIVGGGILIFVNIDYFCTEILGVTNYEHKYEQLQKDYNELKFKYDAVRKACTSCMTKFFTRSPMLKKMYSEEEVNTVLNQFGHTLIESSRPIYIEGTNIRGGD